jgi:flagellar FliL protein
MATSKKNVTRTAGTPEPERQEAPRRKAKGAALFGPLLAVTALLSFFGGAFVSVGMDGLATIVEGPPQEGEARVVPLLASDKHYVSLPQTIYELSGEGAGARYLMASVTLEVPLALAEAADARASVLEGVFQAYVRSLSPEDLQGAAGLYALRQALLHRARRVLGEEAVSDVFISEILVG